MKIQALMVVSISAPNRPSVYLLPRFLPFALRCFQPSSPQDIETERDTVTGKVRNAKDKKRKFDAIAMMSLPCLSARILRLLSLFPPRTKNFLLPSLYCKHLFFTFVSDK
jgi:hypothetical protein